MGRALFLTLLLSAVGGAAAAQTAPLFLEPTHWSAEALRRLGTQGLLPPAADPALAPLTRRHVRASLAAALEHAKATADEAAAEQIGGYLDLLAAEAARGVLLSVLRVTVGWQNASGEARAGDGYFREEDWQGAQALPALRSPLVLVEAGAHLQPWLAAAFTAGRVVDDWAIPAWTLAAAVGPFDVWGGRRRLHYGAGRGGGTVLGSGTQAGTTATLRTLSSFEGVGVHVREPFNFPGFLRFLGPARVETVIGQLPRNGNVERPWIAFGRLIGHPFSPRITLGVNRGAIFGGEGNPVTFGRLGGLLIGLHGGEGGEFENQVFSTVIRYRPPLGPLPLEIYSEWGMDDTAGAIRDMPAIIAGFDVAAVPGLPALSFGLERTTYPESCCGNPIWYRSVFFRGSWADEGRLFAHPLGGHGREWLLHAGLDLPQHGVLIRGRGLRRYRGGENLFSPGRTGRSHGAAGNIELDLGARTRVQLDGLLEQGAGWSTQRLSLQLTHYLSGW
jgi:hypothetical protein